MQEVYHKISDNHRKLGIVLTLVFGLFFGCTTFPVFNFTRELDKITEFLIVVVFLGAYYSLGILICASLKNKRIYYVPIIAITLTVVGMVFRYLLEFGEISNIYNFTVKNIVVHLLLTSIITLIGAFTVRKIKR